MEKVISVSGQNVRLISSGATPLIYKKAFNRDFFKDFATVAEVAIKADKSNGDDSVMAGILAYAPLFQRFFWSYAKNANQQLPALEEWLATFDDFPIFDFIGDLIELMMSSVSSKKN